MPNTAPGLDAKGYRDPQGHMLPSFASTVERDAWVTANGGTAGLPTGYICLLTTPNSLTVWNGAAWRTVATT